MDTTENDSQDGPLAVWQMFNSPTIALFKNLDQATDGLEALITSILNSKREFSDILVQRCSAPDNLKLQCSAFNKWLLGRLFYILSDQRLLRIHKISLAAQLKIILILHGNSAPFLNEILNEYISSLHLIIEFYENTSDKSVDENVMILNKFIPDEVDIPTTVLDLSPIAVCVKEKEVSQNIIIYLMDILCQILSINKDFKILNIKIDDIFKDVLHVLENMDMDLKNAAIEFYTKIISDQGLNCYVKYVERFFALVERVIFSMPLLLNNGSLHTYGFLQTLNKNLSQLFRLTYHHSVNISTKIEWNLLNICKYVLNLNYEESNEYLDHSKNETIFSLELRNVCIQLFEKIIKEEEILALPEKQFLMYCKMFPSFFTRKLLSESIKHSQQFNSLEMINLMETSKTLENIYNSAILSFKSASATNISSYAFSAHLHKGLSLLNLVNNFKIELCSRRDSQKCLKLENITKEKEKTVAQCNLIIFSADTTHNVLLALVEAVKNQLDKSSQPSKDITIITSIFTILLNISSEINIADVELIIEFEGFSCVRKSYWIVNLFQEIENKFDMKKQMLVYLKVILIQCIISSKKLYRNKFKDTVCTLIQSLEMENVDVQIEMVKCSPLLLLNGVITPEELVINHLHPALLSKNQELLQQLVNILPTIVCIVSQNFILTQSTTNKNDATGFKFNYIQGIYVNFFCLHCYKMDVSVSKEFNMKWKKYQEKTCTIHDAVDINFSERHVQALRQLFEQFLNLNTCKGISEDNLGKMVVSFARHSILVPSSIEFLLGNGSLCVLVNILKPITTYILHDVNLNDSLKDSVMNSIIRVILDLSKKCLENNDPTQQELCLECVRQFGLTQNKEVVLPSIKLLIIFLMYYNCTYGPKAALYIRDICEVQKTSPNQVYHKYKKDFCRVIMEQAAFNFLMGQGFASSILKVVRVFGFVGYRDYVSKDIHHALPYLIPLIIKTDKLKPVILEMASVILSTPEEFLSERFPHIYTHIYIFENSDNASKCFDYIQEITKNSLTLLIKKHFRIILTELLLQYCCDPEKVLKACRWLASNDPEYSPMPSDIVLPLTQIADFIQPRFLGVLAYFDSKLVNTKVAMSIKRKALQSFPDILNLMGARHMTPLRFKIIATLRTALSLMEEFPKLNAAAWNAFIHNVDIIALGPILTTIFVSLLPLLQYAKDEINEIFEYLVIHNENILCAHLSDLFFLEENDISLRVKQTIQKHVRRTQPQSFIEKVKWYLKYLNQEALEIKVHTLKFLTNLIKNSQTDINAAIFINKNINPVIVELIDMLITGCRDKDIHISEWSGRCLGSLGALEPSLLPRNHTITKDEMSFAFSVSDTSFVKQALSELARAFHCEKHTKNMDCYALAIQEILKAFEISPTGTNKHIWESFPDTIHQIMLPLLSSRYKLSMTPNPKKIHPVFGSNQASTFCEWAFSWACQVIPTINSEPTQLVLQKVQPSLRRDLRTLVLFLPYIILHGVISSEDNTDIKDEMLAVIGSFTNETVGNTVIPKTRTSMMLNFTPSITPLVFEEGTQVKCQKMVYVLLDFLNRWLLEWMHSQNKSSKDPEYIKISAFLKGFCKLTVAKGNFLCGELERALQYLEMFVEESQDRLQEHLGFFAEIYAMLSEPDCVAGIMRMKQSEPSLSELILAHKVTGELQDAATCYEKCAQQGDIDDERLQGMVEVYLGLDQPYTALHLLQGAQGSEDNALAAEPFWRLAMFDELDKLLEQSNVSNDERWGVRVGHCLIALRTGQRESLELRLEEARNALLRHLGERACSSGDIRRGYTHAYQYFLGLHMLDEVQNVENAIYKIKGLSDGSNVCNDIMDKVIDEWNLRLRLVQSSARTVEPVLRLRRILLEQSKELLQTSHPQTAASLDSHIGKIWLQSAKFARKASIFQQAYIYILNGEKYCPKELFIEKAKLYWMRGQKDPAFYTLKRGLEEHFPTASQLTTTDKKLCAKAKLLIAMYNDETTSVDMDVNIIHYKEAVDVYRQWEKSLVCLAEYYEKVYAAFSTEEKNGNAGGSTRTHALNCYGRALEHGHSRIYQSMPRMLSLWLDFEVQSTEPKSLSMVLLSHICSIINTFSERLPHYLFFTAFSQIISRICHPIKEVYTQIKSIIVKLIIAYPHHSLWMMMSVIQSSYPQIKKRCQEILNDPQLKDSQIMKLKFDFIKFAEKLIELCNKPIPNKVNTVNVSTLVSSLPRLLASDSFSQIMMPHEKFVKIILPFNSIKKEQEASYNPFPQMVYIAGIVETVVILPSLQKPRKIILKGSDGNEYMMMLKPKDDLRKDFRLMEFNAVVNRYLQDNAEARQRRLYIRTYSVLPLNEECGIIEWVPKLLGFRPILIKLYKAKGIYTSANILKTFMCSVKDPLAKKRKVFEEQLLPRHPPVFGDWFRYTFPDPHAWYQARSAYIRTTAVISMVGYILGLGDRHGENILFDSTNGDSVHVDFNCLFNKGESFEWPERVPFRLTHNMRHAMGPLACEGMYRKNCEVTLRVLRTQTVPLMSVIRPFVYDPLVTWQKNTTNDTTSGERINQSAKDNLAQIEHRLQGMVRTKDKQYSLSLSPEGQANNLILEATSVVNLCQMYIGWGPYL